MSNFIRRFLIPLALIPLSAGGDVEVIVQKGDTLSFLLHKQNYIPIYGPHGSLGRTLQLNPEVDKLSVKIYPGQRIILSHLHSQVVAPTPALSVVIGPEVQEKPKFETPLVGPVVGKKAYTRFSALAGQRFYRIDGEDADGAKGVIGSNASPFLNLTWSPSIANNQFVDLGFNLTKVTLTEDETSTLSSRSHTLNHIYLAHHYNLSPRIETDLQIGYSEELFYKRAGSNSHVAFKAAVPYFQLGGKANLGSYRNLTYGLKAAYRSHVPFETSEVRGYWGHGFLTSLFMDQSFDSLNLFGEAFYGQDYFNTKPIDFKSQVVGMTFGVRWTIGDK